MEIHIKTIDHSKQKYETCGDYWYDDEGILQIRVSDMGNKKYEMLVAIHEIIEQFSTEVDGIEEKTITDYDLFYERKRSMGLVPDDSEPGFSTEAPYRKHHTLSTGIEMIIASQIGVDWNEYDRTVNSLSQ